MWLTDIMMMLFAGALICMLLDFAKSYTNTWRVYIAGAVCTGILGFSLIDLLVNWSAMSGPVSTQPADSSLASLYVLDKFGIFVIFTVLSVGMAISFYSWEHIGPEANVGPFFGLLLILLLSLAGIITSGDLLTLFLFWEGMSVAAYGLVAFRKEIAVSLEAALKYLFLAGSGSLIALFGISLVYSLTGSIQLKDLQLLFQKDPAVGALGLAMLIVGLGVEAAVFPLHTWLPDAYSAAPTPVSAVLAGVVTETAVFAIIKIINPTFVIPISDLMAWAQLQYPAKAFQISLVVIALLTMFIGNLGALGQRNVKRLLSYSSIAHVGYMLSALATFSTLGIVAIVFHIWNHGLVKSSFFMLTGNKGKDYEDAGLDKVKGLFHENQLLGTMFALSSLGMMGVPPFGTFWSELLIIQSLLATQSIIFYIVAVVVVLNIILSVGYFSKIITSVARKSNNNEKVVTNWRLAFSPVLLISLSLVTGLIPWLLLERLT
jgi:proton-translocating NADH-quinone oxidoreductase chain N